MLLLLKLLLMYKDCTLDTLQRLLFTPFNCTYDEKFLRILEAHVEFDPSEAEIRVLSYRYWTTI